MSCQLKSEEHADRLLAYSAGKLRGEAAAQLELHMCSCAECAAIRKEQARVWNLLDAWEVGPVSANFNRQLYAKIEAAESESWWSRTWSAVNEFLQPVFARPAFPLAAASLVIVAGFVLDHPGRLPLRPNTASLHASSFDASKLSVDQVEATLDDIEMLRQFDARQDDSTAKDTPSKSM